MTMMTSADVSPSTTHAARMDRNYRFQRHVYDLTRRPYLFGRDRLLQRLASQPNEFILEAGCGTARNLRKLARRHRHTRFFGLDASAAMLEKAAALVAGSATERKIILRHAMAEEFHHRRTFGLADRFDAVFFSYALSMIPPWREALRNGWEELRPGGRLLVVDFWDAAGLPAWCGGLLREWLHRFHTHPRPEIIEQLRALPDLAAPVRVEPVGPRYAFLAECRKQT